MKFSIIIPVYNVRDFLEECLTSVLSQSCTDYEMICIDDGSTDGSGKLLDDYAAKSPRLRVLHQANAGVSAARNAGLAVARGEWVLFLDGDDCLAENLLVRLDEIVQRHPNVDAIAYSAQYIDAKGQVAGSYGGVAPDEVLTGDQMLGKVRDASGKFLWNCWDKTYRRSRLIELGSHFVAGMKYSEDSLFAQTYLAQARQVVCASSVLGYSYRMRAGSAVHANVTELPQNPFFWFNEMYALWLQLRTPGLMRLLARLAAGLFVLGKGDQYAPEARQKGIDFLMTSDTFRHVIIPFLMLHGTGKGRSCAVLFWLLPGALKRKLLEFL